MRSGSKYERGSLFDLPIYLLIYVKSSLFRQFPRRNTSNIIQVGARLINKHGGHRVRTYLVIAFPTCFFFFLNGTKGRIAGKGLYSNTLHWPKLASVLPTKYLVPTLILKRAPLAPVAFPRRRGSRGHVPSKVCLARPSVNVLHLKISILKT